MASAAAQSDNTDVSVPRLSLSVDHPPSTSPFPSPGSPFLPPPRLSAHEFALRTSLSSMRSSAHKKRDDEHPPALAPTPPDDDPTPTTASMKTAFPRSGPSPPASPLPHAAAQPPRPSPPPTPLITIPDPEQGPRAALTSSRPAPPSPALSRRTSAALSRRSSQARSRRQSRIPPQHDAEPSSSSTVLLPQPKRRSLLVKIRDFAFAPSDERHVGRGPDVPRPNRPRTRSSMYSSASSSSSSVADDDAEDARGGWGSFRWNTLSSHFSWGSNPAASSDGPSRTDFERNFDMSSPTEEPTDQYADDDDEGDEGDEGNAYPSEDGPLVPGLYRAMFAFEPEGTAEMALEEEQVVRVVGRGGGVGWAVVEKEGGGHALVPESYLELVQADPTD